MRTAKSSCFGNISIRIGPFGVNLYFFEKISSACCASGTTYSRITGVSLGWLLNTMSPSVIVSNLSSESSIVSRLNVR